MAAWNSRDVGCIGAVVFWAENDCVVIKAFHQDLLEFYLHIILLNDVCAYKDAIPLLGNTRNGSVPRACARAVALLPTWAISTRAMGLGVSA